MYLVLQSKVGEWALVVEKAAVWKYNNIFTISQVYSLIFYLLRSVQQPRRADTSQGLSSWSCKIRILSLFALSGQVAIKLMHDAINNIYLGGKTDNLLESVDGQPGHGVVDGIILRLADWTYISYFMIQDE